MPMSEVDQIKCFMISCSISLFEMLLSQRFFEEKKGIIWYCQQYPSTPPTLLIPELSNLYT